MSTSSAKKIAFVASIFGHFRAFHIPYMRWFQEHGWQVHAFANLNLSSNSAVNAQEASESASSTTRFDPARELLQSMGIICHTVPISRMPFRRANFTSYRILEHSFRELEFDIIHVHTPVASILGRLSAQRSGTRAAVLYTAHGFHFFHGAPTVNWLLYYPVERALAHMTDYVITINDEDFQAASRFSVRREVVQVPGVGLNLERFQTNVEGNTREELRNMLGLSTESFVFLCIAELNKNKNHIQIFSAMRQLLDASPLRDVHCLLVGRGAHEAELRRMIAQNRLQSQVQILGYRQDIPNLLAASDAVLLTSKREGLPRALMEAMAAGKPIIATNVRGNRDLVQDGETGFLVPVNAVEQTTNAMRMLVTNDLLVKDMGERARHHAQKYDISQVLEAVKQVYYKASPSLGSHRVVADVLIQGVSD